MKQILYRFNLGVVRNRVNEGIYDPRIFSSFNYLYMKFRDFLSAYCIELLPTCLVFQDESEQDVLKIVEDFNNRWYELVEKLKSQDLPTEGVDFQYFILEIVPSDKLREFISSKLLDEFLVCLSDLTKSRTPRSLNTSVNVFNTFVNKAKAFGFENEKLLQVEELLVKSLDGNLSFNELLVQLTEIELELLKYRVK